MITRRGAWMLVKNSLMTYMANKTFFFLLAFGWMIPLLVSLFIWRTAAATEPIAGMTQGEFVGYYLLFICVNQLTNSTNEYTVGENIYEGHLNGLLLRPVFPLVSVVTDELASRLVYMLFVIPVALVLALVLHPEIDLTLLNVLLFLPMLVLAWLLCFCWSLWLAFLAFWTTRIHQLAYLQGSLLFLLSGQVAPVALLPGPLRVAAEILPFRYMVAFPVEVLTGQLSITELLMGLVYLSAWLVLSVALSFILWRNGIRRYTAVGG